MKKANKATHKKLAHLGKINSVTFPRIIKFFYSFVYTVYFGVLNAHVLFLGVFFV